MDQSLKTLGLTSCPSRPALRALFRKLSFACHPDKSRAQPQPLPALLQRAPEQDRFPLLVAAYETLLAATSSETHTHNYDPWANAIIIHATSSNKLVELEKDKAYGLLCRCGADNFIIREDDEDEITRFTCEGCSQKYKYIWESPTAGLD